ncbi:hypothetical protein J8F10_03825 [Gemmata sp. G18]|uniref:Carboxypeptidase regulatory-like domain-containing protein n=1 Tax=Gemmata palustris TaxID=2822762 RepID=A0ABS5BNI8_9BACT|nr:hypothetical protein [Gemmata palustris]MBP3954418.1 hypothetical protein [Gemmata palustris]
MCRTALVLAMVLSAGPVRAADPPTASFTRADGWVNFTLERNGAPVVGARVTVLTGARVWASGETGPAGGGTFPLPVGRGDCQVVFNLGLGPSAPVPLTFSADGTVTPPRAPVLGAAECCQPPERTPPPPPSDRSAPVVPWHLRLAGAGAIAVLGSVCLVVVWCRARRPTRNYPQHGNTK